MNRAVVAGDEHLHIAARRFLEHREERRAAEPLLRELPKRDLVARDLVEDRRFRAAVGEQIHEVEDERRYAIGRDDARDSPLDVVALGGCRDLLVWDRRLDIELDELRLEQLLLVRVERLVLALAPPVGKRAAISPGNSPLNSALRDTAWPGRMPK